MGEGGRGECLRVLAFKAEWRVRTEFGLSLAGLVWLICERGMVRFFDLNAQAGTLLAGSRDCSARAGEGPVMGRGGQGRQFRDHRV